MDFQLKPFGVFARTVFCIGRNYAEHAKELGNPIPQEPVVFLKPTCALCRTGWKIQLPDASRHVDHEVELVVAMAGGGRNIPETNALDFVSGYAVGIDVTARDLQQAAKQKGMPWTVSKGFDTFAPLSDFVPRDRLTWTEIEFRLWVNGALRQHGHAREMLFPVPKLIHYLSTMFTLNPGDLIFTGTPAGTGPLQKGDEVKAELQGGMVRLDLKVE